MATRRQKRFAKLKKKYENETLTLQELESLTDDNIIRYCQKVLTKRHGEDVEIESTCKDCLVAATFKIPKRTISDENLRRFVDAE